MFAAQYPCHWQHGDHSAAPTSSVRVDAAGDVYVKFTEDRIHQIIICMSQEQFLAFIAQCEDVRNGIELAQAAANYAPGQVGTPAVIESMTLAEAWDQQAALAAEYASNPMPLHGVPEEEEPF